MLSSVSASQPAKTSSRRWRTMSVRQSVSAPGDRQGWHRCFDPRNLNRIGSGGDPDQWS